MIVIKILVDNYRNVRLFNPLQQAPESTDENIITEDTTYTNADVGINGYDVQIVNVSTGSPLRRLIGGSESFFDIEYVANVDNV